MKKIRNGIVFSNDIERILNGVNALEYRYDFIPSKKIVEDIRRDFENQVNKIFPKVTIIEEDDMLELNNLIEGRYPHCYIR